MPMTLGQFDDLPEGRSLTARGLGGGQIAPPTIIEHYPSHWGAALVVSTVTSILRYSELGYRRSMVDMLAELLEGDLHCHGILRKIYSSIANRAYFLQPAECDESEAELAEEIAEDVRGAIGRIPRWRQHVFGMLWAHYYGATGREIMWRRTPERWDIASLEIVHSRRIAYDWDFKPYISTADYATSGLYPTDYPGKFWMFQPAVVEDYPTRQGVGRSLSYWLAFKRFAARDFVGYVERFGKPFPLATWTTSKEGIPREASAKDILTAQDIVKQIGKGSMPGAAVPDSIKLELAKASVGKESVHRDMIELCNAEMSKAILTGTLTTQVSSAGGNRALGQVQQQGEAQIIKDLAGQSDESITESLVRWYVHLNYGPDITQRLCPRYVTDIDDPKDLSAEANVLKVLVNDIGLEVSESEVRERFGYRKPEPDEDTLGGAEAKAAADAAKAQAFGKGKGDPGQDDGTEPDDSGDGTDSADAPNEAATKE